MRGGAASSAAASSSAPHSALPTLPSCRLLSQRWCWARRSSWRAAAPACWWSATTRRAWAARSAAPAGAHPPAAHGLMACLRVDAHAWAAVLVCSRACGGTVCQLGGRHTSVVTAMGSAATCHGHGRRSCTAPHGKPAQQPHGSHTPLWTPQHAWMAASPLQQQAAFYSVRQLESQQGGSWALEHGQQQGRQQRGSATGPPRAPVRCCPVWQQQPIRSLHVGRLLRRAGTQLCILPR